MSASQPLIVVGVDGSPSAIKALEWAIGQAALNGASIEAVIAWHIPNSYGVPLPDSTDYSALAAGRSRSRPGKARVKWVVDMHRGPIYIGGVSR